MNILIFTKKIEVTSGWGRYSLDLVKSLKKYGHKVLVFCEEKNDEYGDIEQIQILPPPMQFKKTHIFSLAYALRVKRYLLRENFSPDLIHTAVEPYAPISFWVSKILRVPYIITCHGSFAVNMFDRLIIGLIQKEVLLGAAAVVCVSHYTKNRLLARVSKLAPFVIHNGIDPERFLEGVSIQQREPLILGVGALKERKGFDLVIAALTKVLQKIPYVRYIIIGDQRDKEYFNYLLGLVKKHHLQSHVEFLENVSEEKLRAYYKKAKVFILTPVSTQTNFEGFGLVYIEAGAYGLPAIGSYNNGGTEAVIDGETGFLVNGDNKEDISEKILNIFAMNDADYQKMSANARSRSQDLSWDKVILKYIEVYKSILLHWHK